MTADRYAVLGSQVARIYPGNLAGLTRAMRDAVSASCVTAGPHRVLADKDGIRVTALVYQDGELTWTMHQE